MAWENLAEDIAAELGAWDVEPEYIPAPEDHRIGFNAWADRRPPTLAEKRKSRRESMRRWRANLRAYWDALPGRTQIYLLALLHAQWRALERAERCAIYRARYKRKKKAREVWSATPQARERARQAQRRYYLKKKLAHNPGRASVGT
jgi:hypothetical protein